LAADDCRRREQGVAYGASLIIGLFIVWVLAAFGGGWPPAIMLGLGASAALLAGVVAARGGAFDREGAWTDAPARIARAVARFPGGLIAAFGVAATAMGARRARPGFVRLKLQGASGADLARVIETLSAQPGLVAVDADAGSALLHALHEEAVSIDALKALERSAAGGAAS
jgi:multisubunit Na+/H+ antiporter MnhE subunit